MDANANPNRPQYSDIYAAFNAVADDLFSEVKREDNDTVILPANPQPQLKIEQPVAGAITTKSVIRKQPTTTIDEFQSHSKPKLSVGMIGMICGSVLLILMTGTAAWINSQNNAKASGPTGLQIAESNMHTSQRAITEKLTRTDLDPIAPKNLGWRQQAIAALGQVINNDAAIARATPGDVSYQKTHEATLYSFLMEYTKMANLADMGTTGTLTYQDEKGQLVTMPVPSSELFAIALSRIEATLGAQQWREVPYTNSRVATTELMNSLQQYKLQYATWLENANLVYSADQVREISAWQLQQKQEVIQAPSSLPPKVHPAAGAKKQAVPSQSNASQKKTTKPVARQTAG
jgi:hypothetical protein